MLHSIAVCLVASVDNERALATFERTLASTSSERLQAARFLAKNATIAHRYRLSKIRGAERNYWVRHALDQALKRSDTGMLVASTVVEEEMQQTPFSDARLSEELRAQAIEETSAFFLHELRPLVGFLGAEAASEINSYACSKTKTAVDRVRSFLDGIERLRKASAAPVIEEFDLTDLVARVAAGEATRGRVLLDNFEQEASDATGLDNEAEQEPQQPVVKLSLGRRGPVVTTGDPTLVELAVTNAVRNAIEAVLEVWEAHRNGVILNWGITDTDSWIVVLDEGCGLPPGWHRLTEPGNSTKKGQGHFGMGLPIAQRAIESMQGSFRLTPRSGAGVACAIRWPRGGTVE